MDLKNFITETLKQICEATIETQKYFSEKEINAIINPCGIKANSAGLAYSPYIAGSAAGSIRKIENIYFDVAIGIEKNDGHEIGGKLSVIGITLGADKNKSNKASNQSNIKFQIPCVLPNGGK